MIASLLLIIAQAVPWYLFPGTATESKTEQMPLKKQVEKPEVAKAITEIPTETPDTFVLDIPEEINVALALPIGASTPTPDAGSLNFCNGVLLAARDLGNSGLKINLQIIDCKNGMTRHAFEGKDITIGPISFNDVAEAAAVCPDGKFIISPLDQKTASLLESGKIIQVPSSVSDQNTGIAEWCAEETGENDKTIVILPPEGVNTELLAALDTAGIGYEQVQGYTELESICAKDGTTRFFIASSQEAFVSEAIRNISVLSMLRHKVTVYLPSKVRSYENLNVEYLHNAGARIATAYHVEYSEAKDFIYSYRALFNAEPDSFAFHGYDCMIFFTQMCAEYGRNWPEKLDGQKKYGLQTVFGFEKDSPHRNSATKKVVFNQDYSVTTKK